MSGSAPVQRNFIERLVRKPSAVITGAWILVVLAMAFVPGLFTDQDPKEADFVNFLKAPMKGHWLGTDALGQDVWSRLVYGTKTTLWGAIIAVVVATLVGVTLGLLAGYLGGWVDTVVMRWTELLFSIPSLIILLVVYSVLPNNVTAAMTVLGVLFSSGFTRLVRSITLQTKEELFISAAQVSGLSRTQIMVRHLIPKMISQIVVQASLLVSLGIIVQASLAFLGFGPKVGEPSWGGLISDGRAEMGRQAWLLVPGGVIVAVTVVALNIFGDAIRDTATERWSISKLKKRGASKVAGMERRDTPVEARPGALLSVQHLTVTFPNENDSTNVVSDVSFDIAPAEVVGIVGESGCGKSMTASGILGMVPGRGQITGGAVLFEGRDLSRMTAAELGEIRGKKIGFVSQEPMVALDPTWRIGKQIAEAVAHNRGVSKKEAMKIAIGLLDAVKLPDPEGIAKRYPHQVSGGQAQRVAIAFALSGNPKLVIADEPTTALDVTIQAEILSLLRDLSRELDMAVMIITHNWGVVAELTNRAVVMYAGEVVEQADTSQMFHKPLHPYTQGLLKSNPHLAVKGQRLPTIPGTVPLPHEWPEGCRFHERCNRRQPDCDDAQVALTVPLPKREVRCLYAEQILAELTNSVKA